MHKGRAAHVGGRCSVLDTEDDAKAPVDSGGETGAGSTSLEGNDIDVQSVQFNLAPLFSAHPPFFLRNPSSHPYLTSSLLPAAFVKLGVKLSASSILGSSN